MIEITRPTYEEIAERFKKAVGDNDYFNGEINIHADGAYYSLRITSIIYRNKDGRISEVVPVWWEFNAETLGGKKLSDFTFRELKGYIIETNE